MTIIKEISGIIDAQCVFSQYETMRTIPEEINVMAGSEYMPDTPVFDRVASFRYSAWVATHEFSDELVVIRVQLVPPSHRTGLPRKLLGELVQPLEVYEKHPVILQQFVLRILKDIEV